MKKTLTLLMLMMIVITMGCSNDQSKGINESEIISQLTELTIKAYQFGKLEITYDEYAEVYNRLHDENSLDEEYIIDGSVLGKAFKGLDIEESIKLVNSTLGIDIIETIDSLEVKSSMSYLSKIYEEADAGYKVYYKSSTKIQDKAYYFSGYYDLQIMDKNIVIVNKVTGASSTNENDLEYTKINGKNIEYTTTIDLLDS